VPQQTTRVRVRWSEPRVAASRGIRAWTPQPTQGQWWSILMTQRWQMLQWCARGGLKALHLPRWNVGGSVGTCASGGRGREGSVAQGPPTPRTRSTQDDHRSKATARPRGLILTDNTIPSFTDLRQYLRTRRPPSGGALPSSAT
jgi:hypothetical protein